MSRQSSKHPKKQSARQHTQEPFHGETGTQELPTHACVRLVCWTLVFLAVLLITRLVNLGQDVIYIKPSVVNNDESTFTIVASGLLHGQLLYVDLYESKPPGIFLALAGVMSLFGESLQVVRHFGTFCLLVATVASYGIAIRHTTSWIAGLTIAAVMTLTGVANFQPTITETVVITVLMPALWLLVARRGVLWAIFLVGVLVSAATLTRTNVAYVVLALAGYYLWRWWRGRPVVSLWEIVAYGAGGLVPLVPLLWFYWRAGALDDFMFFNVTAMLEYAYGSHRQAGAINGLLRFVDHLLSRADDSFYASVITLFTIAGLCLWVVNGRKALLSGHGGPLVLVFGALGLSILQSGWAHPHYLLQLLPLVAVFTALGFGTLRRGRRDGITAWAGMAVSGLVLVTGLMHYGSASVNYVVNQWGSIGRTSLQHAADLIREDASPGSVYSPTHHLIYWYLKQPPPSKLVHPDALTIKPITVPLVKHGYLADNEYIRVMEKEYEYIVIAPGTTVWQFVAYSRLKARFEKMLATRFVRWKEVQNLVIYKRR